MQRDTEEIPLSLVSKSNDWKLVSFYEYFFRGVMFTHKELNLIS